ncbi:hypothetical protein RMQ97_02225 [Maricaulis sp. D1M11]|uniref:hypothetical protein n=1 Tax=Maricaulis sp. D1M11 TaxID=3076117 RepID=UPI0039B402BE
MLASTEIDILTEQPDARSVSQAFVHTQAGLFSRLLVATLYLGLVLGVSLIATPAKFLAPSLELAAALDVGRVTFALFNRIEWGVFAVLAVLVLPLRSGLARCAVMALGTTLILDTTWLLPTLFERVSAVQAGTPKPSSLHHMLYATLEIAKIMALGGIIAAQIRAFSAHRERTSS